MRAVLFDIDDTLYDTSAFAASARRRAVEAMVHAGLQVPVEEAYAELMEVVREFSSNYGRHYDTLLQRLKPRLRPGVHPGIVIASGVCAYHAAKEHLKAFPDALRCLDALSRTSLLRGVVTNGLTVKQAEKLVRLGLENAFSPGAIFVSEELGVAKPHPRIFLTACERLGVAAGEALYVGDDPVRDVDPAHEAGLLTCLRRGGGSHAEARGVHAADVVVDTLDDLPAILRDRYGVR
jgi:putative hydrolase of the HAD superfamily